MTKPFLETEEKRRNIEELYPLKIGRPEDVAGLVYF